MIWCFGTSHTYGGCNHSDRNMMLPTDQTFCSHLEKRSKQTVYNFGVSGAENKQIYNHVKHAVETFEHYGTSEEKPTVAFVEMRKRGDNWHWGFVESTTPELDWSVEYNSFDQAVRTMSSFAGYRFRHNGDIRETQHHEFHAYDPERFNIAMAINRYAVTQRDPDFYKKQGFSKKLHGANNPRYHVRLQVPVKLLEQGFDDRRYSDHMDSFMEVYNAEFGLKRSAANNTVLETEIRAIQYQFQRLNVPVYFYWWDRLPRFDIDHINTFLPDAWQQMEPAVLGSAYEDDRNFCKCGHSGPASNEKIVDYMMEVLQQLS